MVWLIGSNGMLGKEISRVLTQHKIQWIGTDRDVDITDPAQLDSFAESHDSTSTQTGNAVSLGKTSEKITWVVNCSGYTNVSKAEEEPEVAAAINEAVELAKRYGGKESPGFVNGVLAKFA